MSSDQQLLSLEVLGTPITVAVATGDGSDRFTASLAPFAIASGPAAVASGPAVRGYAVRPEAGGWSLEGDDGTAVAGDAATVESHLLADLSTFALARYDGFAVHAGVVASGGSGVCFPGPSGAGKSTLTAACLGAGFSYVSDEALCIDLDTARVVPFPRPLGLSRHSRALLGIDALPDGADCGTGSDEVVVAPAALGAAVAVGPVALDHVVQLRRRPGPARLEPDERIDSVVSLLELSFNHFRRPEQSVALVGSLAQHAQAWSLRYDDPVEAADVLWRCLGT